MQTDHIHSQKECVYLNTPTRILYTHTCGDSAAAAEEFNAI